ncbi:MAG: hypothetical protein BGO78_13005 [Chloroflexi bacterium 44-23]|mgnify:CR=1 FL=1|nr:MAG: hypothetical protein BGO78_13005 [Chloroflexi bacterium 44-23]
MLSQKLPVNQVLAGDCITLMNQLPPESIDVVFADPPYNLQLRHELWRPDQTPVEAVTDNWDQFADFKTYDRFTRDWLQACRRVLKPNGTLWVIGTYHNIYRVGAILQDLNFWILNDVIWIKTNPMPNFQGVRLTNAHESIIWAQKERGSAYTFNYHALKQLNEGLQMRSDWYFATCRGKERLRKDGARLHSTQKPLALMYRILVACTHPGDLILDPFFGTGTTGVAAFQLGRRFIGIEQDVDYVEIAQQRLTEVQPHQESSLVVTPNLRREARIPFGTLLEHGLLKPGQLLYYGMRSQEYAQIQADGSLLFGDKHGSIHQIARLLRGGPDNGWQVWYYQDERSGQRYPIDHLRQKLRTQILNKEEET